MKRITQAELKKLYDYDPDVGEFVLKVPRGSCKPGYVAGSVWGAGYKSIHIDGRLYLAHRLAWLYVYGDWPIEDLDHRDLDKGNNRIGNLRQATMAQNKANMPAPRTNTSGVKGVNWNARLQKWHARIRTNGKRLHLGLYTDINEAAKVYEAAAKLHHGEFARPN